MNVGVTGTRQGMAAAQKSAFRRLTFGLPIWSFHHGSCCGVDVQAARIIADYFPRPPLRIVCHPGPDGDLYREESGVDDERREPKTHFARNRDIVNETCLLIACPLEMEWQPRGGTWYTVDYARKVGKRVVVVWPDGTTKDSNFPSYQPRTCCPDDGE